MTAAAAAPRRAWLEGLRGAAALQVLLLHYCGAFLPYAARVDEPAHFAIEAWIAGTPLFFFINGHLAVQLFFLISGMVLAGSFMRARAGVGALAAKRFLRLFLPALAAILLSLAWLAWLPLDRAALAAQVGSDWLGRYLDITWTVAAIARDALVDSILLGYRDVSLFDPWATPGRLSTIAQAIVPPLWTLHVEFWGSLMVLALCAAWRRFGPRGLAVAAVVLLWVGGTSHYSLFIAGALLHAAWPARPARPPSDDGSAGVLAVLLIATGMLLSSMPALAGFRMLYEALRPLTLLHAPYASQWQSHWGALAIFVGVAISPPLRRLFGGAAGQRLGRLSFSVYLLHFPILAAVGTRVFLALVGHGYLLACAAALAAGVAVTVPLALLFARWVDRPAIAVSRRLVERA